MEVQAKKYQLKMVGALIGIVSRQLRTPVLLAGRIGMAVLLAGRIGMEKCEFQPRKMNSFYRLFRIQISWTCLLFIGL